MEFFANWGEIFVFFRQESSLLYPRGSEARRKKTSFCGTITRKTLEEDLACPEDGLASEKSHYFLV